jgi:hypothetical protein
MNTVGGKLEILETYGNMKLQETGMWRLWYDNYRSCISHLTIDDVCDVVESLLITQVEAIEEENDDNK